MSELRVTKEMIGREPCCAQDYGGSHYHCHLCGQVTSMMGHWRRLQPGDKWAEDLAEKLGVKLPWEGYICQTK